MHDLNTINKLNAIAHEKAITDWRNDGKFVVCAYEGLHLVVAEPHETPEEAATASRKVQGLSGISVSVLPPFPPETRVGKNRDQSEDRHVGFADIDAYLAHTRQTA